MNQNNRFKFRAWAKDEPFPNSKGKMLSWADIYQNYNFFDLLEREGLYTLMQSTGLSDRNGVEIFDKDIVRRGEEVYFVEYGIEEAGFYLIDTPPNSGFIGMTFYFLNNSNEFEIIGNIFEHEHLLKVTQIQHYIKPSLLQ